MVLENLQAIIKTSIHAMWPSLVIVCVALVCVRVGYLKTHRDHFHFYQEFWLLVAIIYLLLLYQLVTNVDFNALPRGFNLIPFKEITRYEMQSTQFYINVVGNILLFIPFGYIVASYIKPKKIWTNAIIALIVSSTIEFVQYNIGRSFDIDDIILNTVGCICGFLIYVAWQAIERHLPEFLKSDWFRNLICIIILALGVLSILNAWGLV